MTRTKEIMLQDKRVVLYTKELTPSKRLALQRLSHYFSKQNTKVLVLTSGYDFVLQLAMPTDVTYLYLNPRTKRALQIQFIISDIQAFAPDALIVIDKIELNVLLFLLFIKTDFLLLKTRQNFCTTSSWGSHRILKKWLHTVVFDFSFWVPMFTTIPRVKNPNKILISFATYQYIRKQKQDLLQKHTPLFMVYHMDKQLIIDEAVNKQGPHLQQMLGQASCVLLTPNDEKYCMLAAEALVHDIPVLKLGTPVAFLEGVLPEVNSIASLTSAIKDYKMTDIKSAFFNSITSSSKSNV
ncbi:MAG: hypothetical protein LAT76_00245 [Schleiferiaceae bacterium]|nr:hypothetical protein [Schleiferiaceae bacterium]